MKTKLFLFILLLLSSLITSAQMIECGTVVTELELQKEREAIGRMLQSISLADGEMLHFPIQHHIVRRSDGSGGLSPDIIPALMEELNENYRDSKIQFYLCHEVNYINNDTYYDFTNTDGGVKEQFLRDNYNNDKAINVYYFNSILVTEGSAHGYTYYPSGNRNFVAIRSSSATNGSTLVHELGHYFYLYHTHATIGGKELVDGSNCSSAGDLCCDTPADPGLNGTNVSTDCVYIGTETDPKGKRYNPDVYNYMSYSRAICRKHFTEDQKKRIYEQGASHTNVKKYALSVTSIKSQTITTSRTIADNIVELENVKVQNNAKVTLEGCHILLGNGFEIAQGATLEIY